MSFREFKSDRRCLQSILQQAVLQQAEDVVAMPTFVDFHDVDMDIPEPDPIRPGIAIKVVSHFPLFHGADWKTIEPIKGLFSSVSSDSARHKEYFDPLPVQSSGDLGNESFSNLFLRECSGSLNRNTCDVTTSTASDSMSSSSSNHSFQSTLERSSMHSISSQKQDVDPARQNFQLKQWNDRFCELLRFQKKYGHFNVPHDDSNQQLAQWIKRMRYQNQLRKKGAHSTLTDQRFHKLNDVGFVWESHRSSWMINFKALRDFKILHSHCNVPNKEKSLSAWCKHQRREYRKYLKGERTRITPDRITALDTLGFNWDPRGLC